MHIYALGMKVLIVDGILVDNSVIIVSDIFPNSLNHLIRAEFDDPSTTTVDSDAEEDGDTFSTHIIAFKCIGGTKN